MGSGSSADWPRYWRRRRLFAADGRDEEWSHAEARDLLAPIYGRLARGLLKEAKPPLNEIA
jgi:hypothetical protein